MIGLDTNVIVRYLAQDDPVQSAKASRFIERQLTVANPGFITTVAIVETVWVLDRAYGLSDKEIAAALESILQTDVFVVENEQEVFTAAVALREGWASFADAFIAALAARAGCAHSVTFYRAPARMPHFELLS